jgi:hypothetical protein
MVVALALPGRSLALDDLSLYMAPTSLGTPPSKLAAWTLQASVSDGAPPYVTFERWSRRGRVREMHILNLSGAASVTFDGKAGTFEANFGSTLRVTMAIAATRSNGPVVDCAGRMRVPIDLRGTFALRTGTRFFGVIRRARAFGTVSFKAEAPPDCAAPTSAGCTPGSSLAFGRTGGWLLGWTNVASLPWTSAAILAIGPASPDEMVGTSPVWSHWMTVMGLNPLTGTLPTLTMRMPAWSPVQGGGTFTARQTSEQVADGCAITSTTGTFEGSFRARFAGWGVRTVQIGPADTASYQVRTSP